MGTINRIQSSPLIDVAVLAFPQRTASTIYGMYDMFKSAGRDWGLIADGVPGPELMRPRVVATHGPTMDIGNDVRIAPDCQLRDCERPDVICIPEVLIPPGTPLAGLFDEEIAWLVSCYRAGTTIATACSGALLLAEAGLLEGQEATTHWAYCDVLAQRYAGIDVQAQRALVVSGEGGRLLMAGGGTSWLDLAIFLIARFANVEEAMRVARINLIDWHSIGQQPYACLARTRQVEDAVIADCQTWIALNYETPAPVAAMVARSGVPERSFKRRFEQATGMSPLEYVHTLRLEEAKQMLEASALAVEAIANEIGYEDAGFFSRLFKRQVGLTPAQYRKRFGSLRGVLQMSAVSS
ncbi:MAG: helix-turn-helix domain-containing protein [Spongiibacteraceae bacterium]